MIKSKVNTKTTITNVSKPKISKVAQKRPKKIASKNTTKEPSKNSSKVAGNSFTESTKSIVTTSRVEQLALPPIRTLMQNQEEFKHILSERGAGVLEQKIKQSMFSRYGRAQDPYAPHLMLESMPVAKPIKPESICKKRIRPISEGLKTPIAPSRIEMLSKPLTRRLPSAASSSPEREICSVKPSTLNYVPNERILELAQPKKMRYEGSKPGSSFMRFKRRMHCP